MIRHEIHLGHFTTFTAIAFVAALVGFDESVPVSASPSSAVEAKLLLIVKPDSIVFPLGMPRLGLGSAVVWSEMAFLASEQPGGPADFFRAEARLTGDGRILGLRGLLNLSRSPAGDDYAIAAKPPRVAVATRALDQVRAVTLYDFSGRDLPSGGEWTSFTRALARVTDLVETGALRGVGRVGAHFARPPKSISFAFGGEAGETLAISWVSPRGERGESHLSLEGEIAASDGELLVSTEQRVPKRPILWLVDTVRQVPWIGPGPIEWAEGRVFALKDLVKRKLYSITGDLGSGDEEREATIAAAPTIETFSVPPGLEVGTDRQPKSWPPAPLAPVVFSHLNQGEGVWRPFVPDFAPTIEGAPPLMMRTTVRPDRQRPYAKAELIAMDMRQLELHMVAGNEDPQPTTGSLGTGQIPRRSDLLPRVVAAFNGAFKTEHGAYGMMVEDNILLPPQDSAATVATMDNGAIAMGSWPEGEPIPKEMVSFRQNMDPLVENGVVNPRRRRLWGFTLGEDLTQMNTIRSGLCMTAGGNLIYAWGEDLNALTLGAAMNAAGCNYGMHLDMNPYHTAFIFYRFAADPSRRVPEYQAKVALPGMIYNPPRYVNGAPKDFFFVALKQVGPGPEWSATDLAQPAPAFLPAVFRREVNGCQLVAIDLTRALPQIDAGAVPAHLLVKQPALRDEDAVLVAAELGPYDEGRGQLVAAAFVAEMTPGRPTLAIDPAGGVQTGKWEATAASGEVSDAVQGKELSELAASSGSGLAAGLLGKRFLVVGVGPGPDLKRAFDDLGIARGVSFSMDVASACALAVRGQSSMMDLAGRPIAGRDAQKTYLLVSALPQALGVQRLESALAALKAPSGGPRGGPELAAAQTKKSTP